MVAYSFQKQFAVPILEGTKRQTIRAIGKRKHAWPGDELQLYVGMRTKHCKLIGRATCKSRTFIRLNLAERRVQIGLVGKINPLTELFARSDGFAGSDDMVAFWAKHHPGVSIFDGLLIQWGELDG